MALIVAIVHVFIAYELKLKHEEIPIDRFLISIQDTYCQ